MCIWFGYNLHSVHTRDAILHYYAIWSCRISHSMPKRICTHTTRCAHLQHAYLVFYRISDSVTHCLADERWMAFLAKVNFLLQMGNNKTPTHNKNVHTKTLGKWCDEEETRLIQYDRCDRFGNWFVKKQSGAVRWLAEWVCQSLQLLIRT